MSPPLRPLNLGRTVLTRPDTRAHHIVILLSACLGIYIWGGFQVERTPDSDAQTHVHITLSPCS